MSGRKRKLTTTKVKEEKTEDIPSSQTTLEDAYKKPRTRSETKKEKEEVAGSPKEQAEISVSNLDRAKWHKDTTQLLSVLERLEKEMLLIKKEVAITNVNLEKLLSLAIQEQEADSLEEM